MQVMICLSYCWQINGYLYIVEYLNSMLEIHEVKMKEENDPGLT